MFVAGKDTISAQAALMYDAVFVIVEAFNKLLRKKPDVFRGALRRGQAFSNGSRALDCNASRGWVTPWEHGDKISRLLRKVRWFFFSTLNGVCSGALTMDYFAILFGCSLHLKLFISSSLFFHFLSLESHWRGNGFLYLLTSWLADGGPHSNRIVKVCRGIRKLEIDNLRQILWKFNLVISDFKEGIGNKWKIRDCAIIVIIVFQILNFVIGAKSDREPIVSFQLFFKLLMERGLFIYKMGKSNKSAWRG